MHPPDELREMEIHLIDGVTVEDSVTLALFEEGANILAAGRPLRIVSPSGRIVIVWPHAVAYMTLGEPT